MPALLSATDRLTSLKEELKNLEQAALSELVEERNSLSPQLARDDREIEDLTGKPAQVKGARRRAALVGRQPTLQELKDLLTAVPGKTLSLRREGFDVKHVKSLAVGNSQILKMGGKGAWPEVTLLK